MPGSNSFSALLQCPFLRHWLYVYAPAAHAPVTSISELTKSQFLSQPFSTIDNPAPAYFAGLILCLSHLFLALCSSHKGLIAALLTYCFFCFCCNLANLLWTKPSCLILSLVNSYSSFKAQAALMKLCSLLPKVLDFSNDFIINYLNDFPLDWEPDKVKGCVFSHFVLISIKREWTKQL